MNTSLIEIFGIKDCSEYLNNIKFCIPFTDQYIVLFNIYFNIKFVNLITVHKCIFLAVNVDTCIND